jgi:anthranilate/para-aminobenzoate synthase component I
LENVKDCGISPLYEEMPYSSPSSIYESIASPNSFLLESVKGPEKIARFSFIGFNPCLIFKVKNGVIEIETSDITHIKSCSQINIKIPPHPPLPKGGINEAVQNRINKGMGISKSHKPLNVLKGLINSYKQKPIESLPPFQGGLAGVLSYDFVQYLERLPKNSIDDLNIPDAHFLLIDKVIAFDHLDKKCWIIVCPG